LKDALEDLLGRPVDLITRVSIRNPFLRRRIDGTSVPLYAS
jgi:predicted nucleotidyltransferase